MKIEDIDLEINERDTHSWIYISKLDAGDSEVVKRIAKLEKEKSANLIVEMQPQLEEVLCWCKLFRGFKKLGVSIKLDYAWNISSLDFLRDQPALESLNLEGINPAGKDLSVLRQLPKLKELTVVKITKGIEALAHCRSLEKLTLHSTSMENLDFLEEHPQLWWLTVVLGGVKNFEALTETKLKYLELYQVRGLSGLGFIDHLASLEYLRLTKLKDVKDLPDFSRLRKLRRVGLTQLKGITDLSPLLEAKALEDLIVQDFGHVEPEALRVLARHPKLKHGAVRLGSTKKNQTVAKLLPLDESYGPFVFSDGVSE
jgi:hypothetical protein